MKYNFSLRNTPFVNLKLVEIVGNVSLINKIA